MRLSFVWMIAVDLFWILVSDPLIHLFGGSEQALDPCEKAIHPSIASATV